MLRHNNKGKKVEGSTSIHEKLTKIAYASLFRPCLLITGVTLRVAVVKQCLATLHVDINTSMLLIIEFITL
jgi:hypothetical protein